jgi:ATP-dependent Clp protease ATP-binding subunit ClpA
MTQRLERFSQEARRVLNASEREATDMDHPAIMPLHLLLGMLGVSNSTAYRILRDLSLEYRDVLPMVQELSPTMVHAARRTIELSPETRRVLEYAIDESRKVGADCIGSEHLLLGLMKKPDYAIISVLQRVSLDPDTVRRAARRLMLDAQESVPDGNGNGKAVSNGIDPRMKIIQMVDDGKISAAEAGDLLRAMQTASTPAVAYANRFAGEIEQIRGRHIRLTITDKTTRQPKADLRVPVDRLQAELFVLIQLLYNGYAGKVGEWNTPTDNIQVVIE